MLNEQRNAIVTRKALDNNMVYSDLCKMGGVKVAFHGSCRASDYFLGKSELMEPMEEMTEAAS